jgi:hypothetical protein
MKKDEGLYSSRPLENEGRRVFAGKGDTDIKTCVILGILKIIKGVFLTSGKHLFSIKHILA